MSWPHPQPGLVIRYSYLWHREAIEGRDEGVKDRPCAVVVASQDEAGRTRVYVLPITHSAPAGSADAIEIPLTVKTRLGLDGERSWILVNEANLFYWPGPDVRLVPGRAPDGAVYGFLPPRFFRFVRDRFLTADRTQKAALVARTE